MANAKGVSVVNIGESVFHEGQGGAVVPTIWNVFNCIYDSSCFIYVIAYFFVYDILSLL